MLYDLHCHLDTLDDADGAVERASKVGVEFILTNGTTPSSNRRQLELAKTYPSVHAALGLYPNDALEMSDEQVDDELAWIAEQDPLAIGEVGIDMHHDKTQLERQKDVFARVLQLAETINRPVIIHSRKAEAEVIDMLGSYDVTANLHCFGGKKKLALKAADMGVYFSLPTTIVRSQQVQQFATQLPRELILTETDSPWLSPDEHRNEPANISVSVDAIAGLWSESKEHAASVLLANLERFLGRKLSDLTSS